MAHSGWLHGTDALGLHRTAFPQAFHKYNSNSPNLPHSGILATTVWPMAKTQSNTKLAHASMGPLRRTEAI